MKRFTKTLLSHAFDRASLLSFVALAMSFSPARADDRFVVPSSPSNSTPSSPPPAPPPPPPAPSSSSSSAPSYTPSPGYSHSDTLPNSGRFNVPAPNHAGGSHAGPGGGQGPYNPYWGGCYYWGGDYYYWGGQHYLSEFGRYYVDSMYWASRNASVDSRPREHTVPIFFPPSPPPIGALAPPKTLPLTRIAAPAELASYVYEPFYAPLSTRLSEQDLTKKLMTRLESYRVKRSALQAELQNKLDSLKDTATSDRIQQLEAFASEQTPRIVELEATAEQLRSDLLRGGLVGLFSGTGDWNERRTWKLGEGPVAIPREKTLVFEFLVMRAAVFYQEGLSPAQRRLLREVAMELQVEAFRPADKDKQKVDENLLFFSPETARIKISEDLPADLSTKITAYQTEKNRLKTELRDTLYRYDNESESKRVQALKSLADNQAASIATLDVLADDIRVSLAALPKQPGPSAAPAFPHELAARISAYHKEKLAIQKIFQIKLDEIRQRYAPEAYELSKKGGGDDKQTFQLIVNGNVSAENMQQIRDAISALNKENTPRFSVLNQEKEAIRTEVAAFAAAHRELDGEKSVQTLIRNFLDAMRDEEAWQPYQEYRTAVYQPGMSPAQRRLLFEIALEKLALPLPDGEF